MYDEIMKASEQLNPKKNKARQILGNYIRNGYIKVPDECAICGSKKNIHTHHPDYNKPLKFVCLCAKCHKRLHSGTKIYEAVPEYIKKLTNKNQGG